MAYLSIVVLENKARAYQTEMSLLLHFNASFLALSKNIRLGWKGLPGANTLAYYKHS